MWILPSHYPRVIPSILLYHIIFTIKGSFTKEYYTLVTGYMWHMRHDRYKKMFFFFIYFLCQSAHVDKFSVSHVDDFFY